VAPLVEAVLEEAGNLYLFSLETKADKAS